MIQRMDAMTGWGIATNEERGVQRLVRTSDGGVTWVDVTPVTLLGISRFFYLDAETAWLKEWTKQGEHLFRTGDGGKSWVSLPIPPQVNSLQFIDPSTGWAVTTGLCGIVCPIGLYQTNDGGETWSQLPVNSINGLPSVPSDTLNLPDGGAFFFRGSTNIWIGGGPGISFKYFYVTWDGGKTWQSMAMPFKDKVFSDNDIYPNANFPIFFGDQVGYVAIRYQKPSPAGEVQRLLAIFVTQDGGRTWAMRSSLAQKLFTPDNVDFVSAQDGFSACSAGLCVTHDGAQTWQAVRLNPRQKNFFDSIDSFDMDFVTSSKGWLLAWKKIELGGGTTLYSTEDGGVTWTRRDLRVSR